MDDFAPTDRTRLRRMAERGRYDRPTVHAILDEALICHLAMVIDGAPAVIPTAHWRDGDRLYVHGSAASRMLRGAKNMPICIAVSLVDGLVLARSGFHHSINYRSVIIYGTAMAVDDPQAKEKALEAFVEKLTPGRWRELRPATAQEIKATSVLAVDLAEVSAKVRTGPPKDDEPDYGLPIWAGVVPIRNTRGEPIPDPRLGPGISLPPYLRPPR